MPLTWTPLHRAIGAEPGPLTYDDVDYACDQRIAEAPDLEWKREVHSREKADEFAKDVAAMANTGGGLIVFGVHEKDGCAVKINPLDVGDQTKRTLRQYLSRIQPSVFGIELLSLAPRQGGLGVLLMDVPASPDAPHLCYPRTGSNDMFSAPYRYGTGTNWMSEAQLERAYSERFARRQDRRRTLDEDLAQVRRELTIGKSGVWLIGAAEPHRVRAWSLGPVDRERRAEVVELAKQFASRTSDAAATWGGDLARSLVDPVQGLRRWIVPVDEQRPYQHYMELRYDGSVVLAAGYPQPSMSQLELNQETAEGFIADLVGLATASGHVLAAGSWSVQVDMLWSESRSIALFEDSSPTAKLEGRRAVIEARPLLDFTPIQAYVADIVDPASTRSAAESLATDLINQFGAVKLFTI